jgi:hypothetical protein
MIKSPAPVTTETKLSRGPLRIIIISSEAISENEARASAPNVVAKIFVPPVTVYTLDADGIVTEVHTGFSVRGALHVRVSIVDAPHTIPHVDLGKSWLESRGDLTLLPVDDMLELREHHKQRELAKRQERLRKAGEREEAAIAEAQRIKDLAEQQDLDELRAKLAKLRA